MRWSLAVTTPGLIPITHDNINQVTQLMMLGRGSVTSAVYSPDGQTIAVASSVGIWLYDANDPNATEPRLLQGHTAAVSSIAFSSDGLRMVSASRDGTVRVWDATTGDLLFIFADDIFGVNSAAFSPDGLHIVSTSRDATVRVWDATTGDLLLTLEGHTETVRRATFSPDGSRIVSASYDSTVRVWGIPTE